MAVVIPSNIGGTVNLLRPLVKTTIWIFYIYTPIRAVGTINIIGKQKQSRAQYFSIWCFACACLYVCVYINVHRMRLLTSTHTLCKVSHTRCHTRISLAGTVVYVLWLLCVNRFTQNNRERNACANFALELGSYSIATCGFNILFWIV